METKDEGLEVGSCVMSLRPLMLLALALLLVAVF